MRKLNKILIFFFAIATFALMFFASNINNPMMAAVALMFMAWALLPYCLLWIFNLKTRSHGSATAMVPFLLIIGGLGNFLFIDSLFIEHDAQSALALVAVPLYQLIAVGLYWLTKFWLERDLVENGSGLGTGSRI